MVMHSSALTQTVIIKFRPEQNISVFSMEVTVYVSTPFCCALYHIKVLSNFCQRALKKVSNYIF